MIVIAGKLIRVANISAVTPYSEGWSNVCLVDGTWIHLEIDFEDLVETLGSVEGVRSFE